MSIYCINNEVCSLSMGAGACWFNGEIGPGMFKQTVLSGGVILHMTLYYPNNSHALIKTGILLWSNATKPGLGVRLKGMHVANGWSLSMTD